MDGRIPKCCSLARSDRINGQIRKRTTTWLAALVVAFGFVSTASAQVFAGRVDVTIEDSTGGRLPGVSVDLTGPVNQTQVTDAQGQAHFLNLPVGDLGLIHGACEDRKSTRLNSSHT